MRRGPTPPNAGWKKRRSNKGGASDRAIQREILEWAAKRSSCVIGIDPDTHNVGLACRYVGPATLRQTWWVASTHVDKRFKAQQAGMEVYRQVREIIASAPLHVSPLVVVEGMRIRRAQSDAATKNPQALVDLSFCGGMAAAAVLARFTESEVLVVEPGQWKGTVPKLQHHSRLLAKLEWEGEKMAKYARPLGTPPDVQEMSKVNRGDWMHIMDAVGLALWGVDERMKMKMLLQREAKRG